MTHPSSGPRLEVSALQVAYQGRIQALFGIDLHVEPRELVALVGANGAGKSTTLKAVSGMLRADRGAVTGGQIKWDGKDVTNAAAHRMVGRGVVHVMEGRFVFPDLSVRENLILGGHRRPDRRSLKADIEQVLGYFPRLAERLKLRAGYLSGGEQQMLAIGRALMARPRLLLLDEPSMGLSPLLVREVFDRIEQIRRQRELSILLVEQNVNLALRLADRGYVIDTGRIVLQGPAGELRVHPQLQETYLGGHSG